MFSPKPQRGGAAATAEPPVDRALPKALLVEDDPFDARVMRGALRKIGYEAVVTTTLAQATARLTHERFALVLLDLGLPDSWPTSTLNAVECIADRTPVVVVSGSTGALETLRRRRDRPFFLLDKNELDFGTLAAVVRLIVEAGPRPGPGTRPGLGAHGAPFP